MADMDLDLDTPTQPPPRTSRRFLPRASKPKTKPEQINSTPDFVSNPPLDLQKTKLDKNETQNDVVEEEVVNEIDVFFSPSIGDNTKLYVLQYPLRPVWRPYELAERCKEVRVKPDSGEVEIDLAIDVDSDLNYDDDADPRIKITKQTLSSAWRPPAQTAYAVGVLTGNELHLNPVHAVVQLRPSLEHLEPGGSFKKSAANIKGEGIAKVQKLKEERMRGSPAKKSKLHGELSEQARDCPEWLPLQYLGTGSDISTSCLHKMMEKEGARIPFLMCPHDYLNKLCPGSSNGYIKVKGPSIRSLRSLPLDERFKVWFHEGPAVSRFDTLKHLAIEESDEEILQIISKYARLVQGNWVAKSPLVYGKDTGLEVVARDNVLVQFRKNLIFSSKRLPQRPDLRNATKDVLNVFARPSGNDWKFDTPPDITFLKLHPSIEQEQEEAWKKLEEQLNSILVKNRSKTAPKSAVPVNPVPSKSVHKAAGSRVQSGTMHKSMPGATKEALVDALKTILGQGGFRLSQICEHLRAEAVLESRHRKTSVREAVAVAGAIDSFTDDFYKVTNEVAVNIHGVFVLRSSPINSQHDALRKVVIDLFIGQGPDAKIKKALVAEAAKLQLGREMSNEEFRKVITELCVRQNSAWVLKAGDGNPNVHK